MAAYQPTEGQQGNNPSEKKRPTLYDLIKDNAALKDNVRVQMAAIKVYGERQKELVKAEMMARREVFMLKGQLERIEQGSAELKNRLVQAEHAFSQERALTDQYQVKLDSLAEQVNQLQACYEKAEAERDAAKAGHEVSLKAQEAKQQEYARLEDKLCSAESSAAQEKVSAEHNKGLYEAEREKSKRLAQEVDQVRHAHGDAQAQWGSKKSDYEKRIAELETALGAAEDQISLYEKQKVQLNEQLELTQKELSARNERLAELTHGLEDYRGQTMRLGDKAKKLELEIAERDRLLEEYEGDDVKDLLAASEELLKDVEQKYGPLGLEDTSQFRIRRPGDE